MDHCTDSEMDHCTHEKLVSSIHREYRQHGQHSWHDDRRIISFLGAHNTEKSGVSTEWWMWVYSLVRYLIKCRCYNRVPTVLHVGVTTECRCYNRVSVLQQSTDTCSCQHMHVQILSTVLNILLLVQNKYLNKNHNYRYVESLENISACSRESNLENK